jgi:hypothetical protein
MQYLDRFSPVIAIDEVVPIGDDIVHRASRVAIRDPAINAASALLGNRLIRERDCELAIVLPAFRCG